MGRLLWSILPPSLLPFLSPFLPLLLISCLPSAGKQLRCWASSFLFTNNTIGDLYRLGSLGLGPALRTGGAIVPEPYGAPAWRCHRWARNKAAAAEGRGPATDTRHHGWEMTGRAGKWEGHWQRTAGPRAGLKETLNSGWQSLRGWVTSSSPCLPWPGEQEFY